MCDKIIKIKRIVLVKGGIETLEYFSFQMGKYFEKQGCLVFYFDLQNEIQSAKKLRKFIRTRETVLLTFNFEGLEKELGVYREGIGYIWEEYQIPCYNIAVDHPYYYHNRIMDLPKQYYHISIDRKHETYFKEYYPEFTHLMFLPLAGSRVENGMHPSFGQDVQAEFSLEKKLEVVFTGNYTPPSFCDTYIYGKGEDYAHFYKNIIHDLLTYPQKTVEETAILHCKKELGELSKEDLRQVLHHMIFIDMYVRNYWRGEIIKTLADAGIVVDVFGKGWETLDCKRKENLHIHPQITSLECLQQIAQAKISLNVMPWFKDGAHDRVFNSILNGAVCMSDRSEYMCEALADGEGVVYYELEHRDNLPKMVKELLSDGAKRQEIWEKGVDKAERYHTWEKRAERIWKILKNP